MNKYKIGEIVIFNTKDKPEINGEETEVIGIDDNGKYLTSTHNENYVNPKGIMTNSGWAESALLKLPPKDEPTTWEECIFQPAEIVA